MGSFFRNKGQNVRDDDTSVWILLPVIAVTGERPG